MRKTISVIIPARTDSEDLPVLESLKKAGYPKDRLEVILVTGNYPSIQRNKAVEAARGGILYFFNRDSRFDSDIFDKAMDIFNKDEKIAGVGGPDVTPEDNNYIQRLFGYALGSYFAHWKMRARYSPTGKERPAGEKEIILSNFAVKKEVYLKFGGFNEKLYPNEENELINRIIKNGYKIIYSPALKIYRDRRRTPAGFAGQFYKYGRGRMSQILIEGAEKNLLFFIPVIFVFCILIAPFVTITRLMFLPLFLYAGLGIVDAAFVSIKNKKFLVPQLFIIYVIMHLSYASGMIVRLAQRLFRAEGSREYICHTKTLKI